jgi:predicted DNA-binding transcriptional regulator AlpA
MRDISTASTLDQIIRPRAVASRLGVSPITLWRMRQRREFPEPITISAGAKGWRERDVAAWLVAREAGHTNP